MASLYSFIPEITSGEPIPAGGIHSKTIYKDDALKIVVFAFAAGEELSAHTAPIPAVMHFLEGEAEVRLAGDTVQVTAGAVIHMTPRLEHAISAKTPVRMALWMLTGLASK